MCMAVWADKASFVDMSMYTPNSCVLTRLLTSLILGTLNGLRNVFKLIFSLERIKAAFTCKLT